MATKYATVMFTDIKDFTETTYSQSRKELGKLLRVHDKLIRPIFRKHGGKVVKTIGDSFMVVFTSPTNAVLCGVAIQGAVKEHNKKKDETEKFQVRIGISSGEITTQKSDYFGTPVNVAARVQSIAPPGQVYLTEAVFLAMNRNELQTAEVGHHNLKGIPEDMSIHRVLSDATGWEPKLTERIREKLPRHRPSMRKVWWALLPVTALILIIAIVLAIAPSDSTLDDKATPQYVVQLQQGLAAATAASDQQAMLGYLQTFEQLSVANIDARTALTISQAYGALGNIQQGLQWLDRTINKADKALMNDAVINVVDGYMAALNPSTAEALQARQLLQKSYARGKAGANTRGYVARQLTSSKANTRRNIYYSFIEAGKDVPGDLSKFFQLELAEGGASHVAGLYSLLPAEQRKSIPPPV